MHTDGDRYAAVVLVAGLALFWLMRELVPWTWGVLYWIVRRLKRH